MLMMMYCMLLKVSGKFQLKGHSRVTGLASLNVDGEDQYMPRQKRDVTYVSRLQVLCSVCELFG